MTAWTVIHNILRLKVERCIRLIVFVSVRSDGFQVLVYILPNF